MKSYKILLLTFMLMFNLAALGCDDEKKAPQTPEKKTEQVQKEKTAEKAKTEEAKKEEAKEVKFKIYFPNEQGTKLVAVNKTVKVLPKDKYKVAVLELLKGSNPKGTVVIIPKKTKLKSIKIQNGSAVCDFSGDMVKYFVGGSTGEEMMIASIVNTLTQFTEITSVKFLIDGNEIETIAGHMDLTEPISHMDY